MRKGTLTVKLKFKVLPDGLSGQSVAGEPVFPASIAQGNTFEVDISPICDTRKAEVKYSLVSNSLESVTDTAKIYIPASLDAYNIAFKRKLVQSIIYCATERERVWATIDYEATRLFTGIVDLSNLTIQSYSYQGDIELTLKDNGYLLDEKIAQSIELPVQAFPRFNSALSPKTKGVYYKDPDNANAFYFWNGSAWAHKESFSDTESKYFHPDATVRVWSSAVVGGELVESVVGALLGMAGYSVSGGTIDPSASDTSTSVVRCFTYDMSEDKTYKEVLDTLLKEYRMCLTFTPEGKVRIVSLSHTSIHATRDIGYGLKGTLGRRDGIKTTFEASKKDGVKLKYSSGLAVRREQSIYSENLGSEFDENGELKGTAIKPQQCLPETGDITATYQEFNAKFLDRAYTTKVNRKENEDLSIISTHGHHLEVAQKGGTLTYPAFTVGESAEHGTGANPYFMPKKAQVLFRNDYEMKNKDPDSTEYEEEAESHSIYLQIFNIVADVLYRDKTTTIYAPSATANPETYESTYLFDDGPARTFANFYLGWNQYGAMKTDWTEYKGTVDTIGSIIGYQHTDSAISSYCLLSEETISFTGSPDVPFVIKMHGIGIAPYNDKPVQSVSYMGDNKNRGANGATGPQGEKGEAGATGTSVTGIVEEYALSTSSTSVTGTWGTAVPTLTPTNRYLWNRSKTQYSNGTASGYTTPVVIGVYGDKGDTGGTGATGRGISSITEYYLASASPTAPSASDTGWSTSAQTPTEAKPYLWNKTVVTYTSGSPTTTIAMIGQSIKGNPGATGATGNGIKSVTVTYGVSSSASTQPTSWSSTIPAVAENQFLWTRTITDYTNDAVADTVTYTYAKQGKSGSAGTSVTVSSIQYQAGTSATTVPTGTWSNSPVSVAQGQYLWTKTVFSDGKVAYGVTRQGVDGDAPELMVIDTDTILLNAYADGPVKNYDGAEINASVTINNVVQTGWAFSIGSKTNVSVSVNSSTGKYTVTAMDEGKRTGSFVITAKKGGKTLNTQAYVQKLYDTGMVSVSASGSSFGFYADNVPHNASESIEITVALTGFSASYAPPCTLDGDSVTLTNGKYVVTPSMLSGKDSVMFVATGTYNTSSVVISKILDIASMSLSISRTTFGYYADNYPHTGETPCVATVIASGLSTAPTIKVNGISKTLTASSPKYTLTIANSDLAEGTAPTLVEATYGTITQSSNIEKVFDVPTITINLTKDFFQYYADGVIRDSEDSIGVSITYRGLYEKPVFKYGSNVTLGTSTLYDYLLVPSPTWINDGFFVEAYSSHIDTSKLFTATFIKCSKDQPSISLVASATQFHQTGNGTASPQTITVTPEVAGLSASAKITYTFGAETITLTNGSYVINSSDVSTYKTMTASWNNTVYGSLTILKTVDGKSMSYMYASCPEAYLPGGYPFGTDSNAIGEADTAIGASYGWSESVPDVPDGYVLWIKTISPDGKMFIYRPQGLEGKSEGVYLGTGTSTNLPTKRPDGSDIKEGDYYLDITDTTSPVPYEMKNGTWTAIDGSSAKWTRVASAVQGDVAKYCPNISNSNGLYGFFKNLSAVNGFVDGLGTRQLTITNGGYIQSQSYADSNGLEGFYLPDDGNAIFETGLFRGGISNGWAIFGGLDVNVTATMTQAELYRIFRNAGVGSGLYFSLGTMGAYAWKSQNRESQFRAIVRYGLKSLDAPVLGRDLSLENSAQNAKYCDIYALGETRFLVTAYVGNSYYAYLVNTSTIHETTTSDPMETEFEVMSDLSDITKYASSPYCKNVSSIITGNSTTTNICLVYDGHVYLDNKKVLDSSLATLGTMSSPNGAITFPILYTKPSITKNGDTLYMPMVIGGSYCFASSTNGISWTKAFSIQSGDDSYRYYSPVLVNGTWYCLRASLNTTTSYVTMQFCKSSGNSISVIKEFDAVKWTNYSDSELNYLAYGNGKILFSVPSDKVLYVYDISSQMLSSDYSIANIQLYSGYLGIEGNMAQSNMIPNGFESGYIAILNMKSVQGIWFDTAKNRFVVLHGVEDCFPIVRFINAATMESEYLSPTSPPAGLTSSAIASGTIWMSGDKIAFGYQGSAYTYAKVGKCNGEGAISLTSSDIMLFPYVYAPDALSIDLDSQTKKYHIHFFLGNGATNLWTTFGSQDKKEITIDGAINSPVSFTGLLCLRPSITAPRGAIISGANLFMIANPKNS